eukprot:scaffold8066_cov147-Skeletonema_menzelii.AAC.2
MAISIWYINNCWSSSSTFHLGGCYYCCHYHIPIDEYSDSIGAQPLLICNLPRQYNTAILPSSRKSTKRPSRQAASYQT